MVKSEVRADVHLKGKDLLVNFMTLHGYSNRSLAERCGSLRYKSTIAHLRSGERSYCDAKLANKIAKALDAPVGLLFEVRPSIVSREVGRAA